MIIMKAEAHNYCFSIMVMFNEDTNDDYHGADDGWCRGDNDVKGNCASGCIHCGCNSKR